MICRLAVQQLGCEVQVLELPRVSPPFPALLLLSGVLQLAQIVLLFPSTALEPSLLRSDTNALLCFLSLSFQLICLQKTLVDSPRVSQINPSNPALKVQGGAKFSETPAGKLASLGGIVA